MKRLFPALLLAATVHAALFTADMDWFGPGPTTPPQATRTTIRLMARAPVAPAAIHPLPTSPPRLPPPPQKPAATPPPAAKRPAVVKQKPAAKPAPVPPSPAPEPIQPAPLSPAPSPPPVSAAPERLVAGVYAEESVDSQPADTPQTDSEQNGPSPAPALVMAAPLYSDNPPPVYPRIARRRGYQGTVILDVFVQENGRVGNLRIATSSRFTLLDRAALKAVRRWTFKPGRRGQETVSMWVRVPVLFQLE